MASTPTYLLLFLYKALVQLILAFGVRLHEMETWYFFRAFCHLGVFSKFTVSKTIF